MLNRTMSGMSAEKAGKAPGEVLFISLAGIGNLITQLPSVNKIKRLFPEISVDFLVTRGRGGKEILQGNPLVREILELPPLAGTSRLGRLAILARRAGLGNYAMAVTGFPNQGLFSAVLMRRVADIRIQHAYPTLWSEASARFLDHSPVFSRKHFVLLNLDLVPGDHSNAPSDFRTAYYENPEEAGAAEALLSRQGPGNHVRIGLHPGSFWDMTWKRWPREHWVKLVCLLGKELDSPRFFLFGTDMDGLEEFPFRPDLAVIKNRNLRSTASLIKRMDLLVSGDSGPGHLASLFRIPQVVLFGGTDPAISRPFSPRAVVLEPENHEPFYLPHRGLTGPPSRLIGLITPRRVADKVREVLHRRREKQPFPSGAEGNEVPGRIQANSPFSRICSDHS